MVGFIDIHSLNLEELTGVIGLYPWYSGARKELCVRMKENGSLSDALLSQTALYLNSSRILFDLTHTVEKPSDESIRKALSEKYVERTPRNTREVFIAGGDYFSQNQYKDAKRSDDNIFSSFAGGNVDSTYEEPEEAGAEDICTETLAQIFVEQGYFAEAKSIYSKLSLRYPEKSVYFAALIEKINELTI